MNSKLVPIALGITLAGVTAFVVYFLYKKELEDEDGGEITTNSMAVTVELPIPIEMVPSIIGRGGSNVKEIERDTGTRIYFKDKPSSVGFDAELVKERICIIRGNGVSCKAAQKLIKEAMQEKNNQSDVSVSVPQWAVSKIIGKNGDNIREMRQTSGAKIKVEEFTGNTAAQRKVSIKGTRDQIRKATDAIESCISSEKIRREKDYSISRREPRGKNATPPGCAPGEGNLDSGMARDQARGALESPSPGKKECKVFG